MPHVCLRRYVIETTPQPPPPPPPAPATNFPPIWPQPASFTNGSTPITVDAALTFTDASATKTATIAKALERYTKITFAHASTAAGALSEVTISIDSADESHPQLHTDETYTLTIPVHGKATILAKTIYGAMHALETFSQLVRFDYDHGAYIIDAGPWQITDAPRFPHRGLMIDTARHFETLASIRTIVDSLPYSKLNVLHWHMSDDQSFPMESKTFPKLWDGAYSNYEKYGFVVIIHAHKHPHTVSSPSPLTHTLQHASYSCCTFWTWRVYRALILGVPARISNLRNTFGVVLS